MKFFNIVIIAALAALTNAAAVAKPEAGLDLNVLEKRCKATGNICTLPSQCCNRGCISGGPTSKFIKRCN
ncbi:hypothetical protein N7457_007437 [Penicillium paradoxum]|uniref:uncharacterized protein n=1 Tax=Penicillium paradoxum TaxID=176176 RepID=UPI0025493BAC|nr:uncharacterized protein N7457_007437 [Penicillium paradoxum]KAJ5779717.1 hypothetical protein N7457_007437 [Penicillium paradoxum]